LEQTFSNVRVHTDSTAAGLSQEINAKAFTYGSNIFFNKGYYQTDTKQGKHLLAHELTHTVQQGTEVKRKVKQPNPGSGGGGNYGDPVPDGTPVSPPKDDCPDLIPPFPKPSAGGTKEKSMDSDIINQLLGGISFNSISSPFGLFSAIGGMALDAIWDGLPLSMKIKAIDAALDLAERTFLAGKFVGRYQLGRSAGWVAAGLLGFVRALKKQGGARKVALFEKMAKIAMGKSMSFTLGALKGLVMGIFIDGLVGIIQLIIDLFCLVPKIIQFFAGIKTFFEHIPIDLLHLLFSIEMTKASIRSVLDNAVGEFVEIIKNPSRAVGLLNTVYDIGAGAAEKMGHKMGDAMISYAGLAPFALGEIVGRIGGMVVFEVLLTYFTAGAGGFISAAKIGLKVVGKALMKIGKYIFAIVKYLGKLLNQFKAALSKIGKFLSKGLKKVTHWLSIVIDDIKRIFGKFQRYCRPGSVVCLITTISKRKVSRIRKAFKGLPEDQIDDIIKALDTKFARKQISNADLNWVLRKIEAVSDPRQKQILGLLASDTRTPWSMLKRAASGKLSKKEWMFFSGRLRGLSGEVATELLEAAGKLKLGSKSVKITGKQVSTGTRSIDFKVRVEGRSYDQLLEIKATTPASWKKGMDAYLKKAGKGKLTADEKKAAESVERMLEQLKEAKTSSGKTPILGVADNLSASEVTRLKGIIRSGASIPSPQILKVPNDTILEVTRSVKSTLGI
jgi:hypothetical protein